MPGKVIANRWSEAEKQKFEALLPIYGNNWKQYVQHFPNRDRNMIKCYFRNHRDKCNYERLMPQTYQEQSYGNKPKQPKQPKKKNEYKDYN